MDPIKVYIVEDDDVILKALKKFLQNWSYEVHVADYFSTVYEKFLKVNPDLVLLDVSLPFFNGYYWCEQIRKSSNVPIIFISSADENLNKIMAMNMGADDYINNKTRYCLWLDELNPSEYRNIKEIRERLEKVSEIRKKSPTKSVRECADSPYLFTQIRQPDTDYIIVPRVSSERRKYIPIGFVSKEVIASDSTQIIPENSMYLLGILTSNVHMAWMRVVAGRLKSDYRYSPFVYNNFPWPNPTSEQKERIEKTAQMILDARNLYPDSSLADLYDDLIMPPELRKAHQENDKAVMEAYGFDWRTMTESECVAELMKLYQALVK